MTAWTDSYWWSNDGLRLHYRDYPGSADRPLILCIPGLTRNARDFEGVAERLAGDWRVLCVDLRGRGESAYAKDPMTYGPLTYLQDLEALLRDQQVERLVPFGTSLGGLLTFMLAAADRTRIAGALLNDVGPVLEGAGLERIRGYVGRSQSWPTWLHAARALAEQHRETYPDWQLEDWLRYAKRVAKLGSNGRIVIDYDLRIAEPMKLPGAATGFDLWAAFDALSGAPVAAVRGASSDILSVETLSLMAERHPDLDAVTVPGVGHAPTLEEPEAQAAIDRLLAKVAG